MSIAERTLTPETRSAALSADRQRVEITRNVAARLAHELRNPVFGIASAARLLRYRVGDDPVVERNIGRILREAERLNSLVTALLEYGRPAPARSAAADPDEVWADVLHKERGALESKALSVRHMSAQPRSTCSLDAEQVSQAFSRLLLNAIEAAPEGTDLTLTSTSLPGGAWRSELRNRGEVVPAESLPYVFDLLVSTKPGHAGVGLAVAQRIVTEHGGTVSLESTAERGTVVTVTLPSPRGNA